MTSLETVSEAEVEAVARAIAAADDDEEPYWDDLKPYWKEHYCKCARAALTAAAQVRAQAQWQPIDTAPAGVDILLCWPSGARRLGYFNGRGWLCDGVSFDEEPTYWMPFQPAALGIRKGE